MEPVHFKAVLVTPHNAVHFVEHFSVTGPVDVLAAVAHAFNQRHGHPATRLPTVLLNLYIVADPAANGGPS